MRIISSLTPKVWLSAAKEQMSGHLELGAERYTGFFIGPFFYITHHAGHEWNRRITNEKNAAVGYIRKTEDGSEVRCMLFKGLLCPAQFLSLLFFTIAIVLLPLLSSGIRNPATILTAMAYATGIIVLMAPIATLFESLTERSQESRKNLIALLIDPADPFSYLHNEEWLS